MEYKIEYESDTLLPDSIADKFHTAIDNINQVRGERDKVNCILSKLKGDVIRWLAANQKQFTISADQSEAVKAQSRDTIRKVEEAHEKAADSKLTFSAAWDAAVAAQAQ